MASFTHARSNSFPSTSHPTASTVEEHLCRLRSAEPASSSSASSVCSNLARLTDLHESLYDLIQLPSIQKELSSEQSNERADKFLEGSVRLLDVCSTTKDVIALIKESVKELESVLRRNKGCESSLARDIDTYSTSRKTIDKVITKCIKNLKTLDKKSSQEGNNLSTVSMLEESEVISLSVLKSVLLYLSNNKNRSKPRGWSLVNKFVQPKRVHCKIEQEQEDTMNLDEPLSTLTRSKSCKETKVVAIQNALKQLRSLEMTIQEIEELLETMFRSLIKRRATLLNIVCH